MQRITDFALATLLVGMACSPATVVQAQQRLYTPNSTDIIQCPGQSGLGRRLLEQNPGHFGCGVLEYMTTPPRSGGYATLAEVRAAVGEPRVRRFCPPDPRARRAEQEIGAVVVVDRPFDPQRRPDVANTLIRDAMRLLYARCPARPLGTPSMGFVQLAGPGGAGGSVAPIGEVRSYGLGIWFHQTWGPAARQTVALRWSPSTGITPVAPTGPWVSVRSAEPRPALAERGGIRGRLAIQARGRPDFTLLAYSNGRSDGLTNLEAAPYQCTQLIVRYAQGLGLTQISTTRDIGDGKDVARNFATRSGQRFTFHDGTGSSIPPRLGSVVSIGATADDGTPWRHNPYGHVGIVQAIEPLSENQMDLVLFDQNFPLPGGQWKRIRFVRASGLWTGIMSNSVGGAVQIIRISGWANPTS